MHSYKVGDRVVQRVWNKDTNEYSLRRGVIVEVTRSTVSHIGEAYDQYTIDWDVIHATIRTSHHLACGLEPEPLTMPSCRME